MSTRGQIGSGHQGCRERRNGKAGGGFEVLEPVAGWVQVTQAAQIIDGQEQPRLVGVYVQCWTAAAQTFDFPRHVELASGAHPGEVHRYGIRAHGARRILHPQVDREIQAVGQHVPVAGMARILGSGDGNGEDRAREPLALPPAARHGLYGRITLIDPVADQVLQQHQRNQQQQGNDGEHRGLDRIRTGQ